MKNPVEAFKAEVKERIQSNSEDKLLNELAVKWVRESMAKKYVYNFTWLGRPIIQYPEDVLALQEIIWEVKPDLIIETGIAHGGQLIFSASLLELLGNDGQVLGVDIDIREHNRKEIESHPMSKRITMIEGSSIAEDIVKQVYKFAEGKKKILVCLDSNHTHDHVLEELKAYSPLVNKGSYCVVLDTFVEDMPENFFSDRPWDVGDNPKTAVWEFLKTNDHFEIDEKMESKLLITAAPNGFLKRVK